MKFDPDAGSLKTSGSERIIPLHPALLDRDFLKFVATIKSGPLFAELSPDKFGKRGGNGTKMIGRFVRQLGLKDIRLSPSHSWRHRIKTLGRKHGLAQDILNAITGHATKSVADYLFAPERIGATRLESTGDVALICQSTSAHLIGTKLASEVAISN